MRELTCDDVNRSLAKQEHLLAGLLERLKRGLALVIADTDKLNAIKQQLSRDLKDKVGLLCPALAVYSGYALAGFLKSPRWGCWDDH